MDTKKLYQEIKKIAEEQQRDSCVMSRADLAYMGHRTKRIK